MDFKAAKEYILNRMRHELPARCFYHSVEHTLDVLQAATLLAEEEHLGAEELLLLQTAVAFHDSGFIVRGKGHEAESCNIAKSVLPGYGYSATQLNDICNMIMATKIPQRPHDLQENIICDADLDYLGRDDYFIISDLLLKEMQVEKEIDKAEWLKIQIAFLKQHTYHTVSARAKREHKKQVHLQTLEKELSLISNRK